MSRVLRLPDQAAFAALRRRMRRGHESEKQDGVSVVDSQRGPVPAVDWPRVLAVQLLEAGLPMPLREYYFAASLEPPRAWRFDLAWPDRLVAVEVDGCVHRIKSKWLREQEKRNEAAIAGWRIISVTPAMVRNMSARLLIRRMLDGLPPRKA